MAERRRTAVLISGRGSNLRTLIEACGRPAASAEIALVISNRADAAGIEHARAAGIATEVIPHGAFATQVGFDNAIDRTLHEQAISVVCLAGFMRVLSPWFVERWRDRLLNIHPSLLPAFRGLDTHRRVLAAGVRFTGCTVHLVRAEVDAGPIVAQAAVPVHQDDTEHSLAARVLEAEHRCYPIALELLASGRVRVIGERTVIDDGTAPDAVMLNPASP
ncbi:MAG TPA: phosphoribosylglycinamide formyltransferase [Geminicoccaceae bacterium]|nr:phosphoribosylglycinamide formyltransferase [Geminicoccaceae bacterium]